MAPLIGFLETIAISKAFGEQHTECSHDNETEGSQVVILMSIIISSVNISCQRKLNICLGKLTACGIAKLIRSRLT